MFRLYSDDEKPAEFRLFMPIADGKKRGGVKDKGKPPPASPNDSPRPFPEISDPGKICMAPCSLIEQ